MKYKLLILCNILYIMFFSLQEGWSAEFHAFLGLSEEYNDNVLLKSDHESGDYISRINPGLSFSHRKDENLLELKYSSTFIVYNKYSRQDTFAHTASVIGETDPSKKISAGLNITDTYRFFVVDPRREDQPTLIDNMVEGNVLSTAPSLRLRPGKSTSVILGYQYTNRFYKDYPGGMDSEGHLGSFSLEQEIGPDVVLNLGSSYSEQKFERSLSEQFAGASSYENKQVNSGINWILSQYVSTNISYGHTWREYDTGSDFEYSNWETSLVIKPFTNTLIKGAYVQSYSDDVFGRSFKTKIGSLSLTQDIGRRFIVDVESSYSERKYNLIDRESEARRGKLGLQTNITSKLSFYCVGGYQKWDTKPGDVSREIYTGDVKLSYQMLDWLLAEIGYRYLASESVSSTTVDSSSNIAYRVHTYFISVRGSF